MNNELITWIKQQIYKSLSYPNIFDNFIKICQDYYDKPVHTLLEMKECTNTKLKGDMFEHFCYLYFKNIKDMDVWFIKDLPFELLSKFNLNIKDMGIDLIVKNKNDEYYAIQVKYRKRTKSRIMIGWKDLSTFYALVSRSGPFTKHIVFTNADSIKKIGQHSIKDKSICIKTLQGIKYDQWLKICGSVGNSISELPCKKPTITELREKRLLYYKV